MKKLPQRTCIGCNNKKDKHELIRIVKNKQGEILIEKAETLDGRGAYICDNLECLEKAFKAKKLEKSFKTKINNDIYENLRKRMKE